MIKRFGAASITVQTAGLNLGLGGVGTAAADDVYTGKTCSSDAGDIVGTNPYKSGVTINTKANTSFDAILVREIDYNNAGQAYNYRSIMADDGSMYKMWLNNYAGISKYDKYGNGVWHMSWGNESSAFYEQPVISSNGRYLLVQRATSGTNYLYLFDTTTGTPTIVNSDSSYKIPTYVFDDGTYCYKVGGILYFYSGTTQLWYVGVNSGVPYNGAYYLPSINTLVIMSWYGSSSPWHTSVQFINLTTHVIDKTLLPTHYSGYSGIAMDTNKDIYYENENSQFCKMLYSTGAVSFSVNRDSYCTGWYVVPSYNMDAVYVTSQFDPALANNYTFKLLKYDISGNLLNSSICASVKLDLPISEGQKTRAYRVGAYSYPPSVLISESLILN